jgi:2-haloacid dehalogenase
MESWQPFPDTVPALRAAREAGLKLWIVSNTDGAIIDHSLRHLGVEFEGVTVAEDCRAYKPSTEPFEHALRDIGGAPEEIVHVAFGFKYDIGPAKELGLRTAWVNRYAEPAPGAERPDHEWRDLWPLAAIAGER